jgi:hypothetical protein
LPRDYEGGQREIIIGDNEDRKFFEKNLEEVVGKEKPHISMR